MNIEHRTLNVQHRIMNSVCREPFCRTVNLKKILINTRRKRLRCASGSTQQNSAVFRLRLQRDTLVLK